MEKLFKIMVQKKTAEKTHKYYNEAFNQQSRQKKHKSFFASAAGAGTV